MTDATPRPDAATRVRELRDAGASFSATARMLTAEGYPTKGGGPWYPEGVRRLLLPPKPAGERGFRGQHTEEAKRKMSESHKRAFAEGRRTGQNKHNAEKTHCPKGHPYDEENTYIRPDGGRSCKACTEKGTRKRRKRLREENPPVPRVLEKPEGTLDYRMGSEGRRPYGTMHLRVRRARGPAKLQKCAHCAGRGIDKQAKDWAMLHDRDGKDIGDYIPLCRRCHIFYDRPVKPEPPSVAYPLGRSGGGPGDPALGRRRAGQQRAKTHCPAGHEYTEENTYILQRPGGRTARQCKTCTREKAAMRKGA